MKSFIVSSVVVIVFVGIGILPMLLLLPSSAFAQSTQGTPIDLSTMNPFAPCDNLSCVFAKIISGIMGLAPAVVAIMVLIGGYQIVTAGGDPAKLKSGKQTVLYAVIGFATILIAQGVALLIQDIL